MEQTKEQMPPPAGKSHRSSPAEGETVVPKGLPSSPFTFRPPNKLNLPPKIPPTGVLPSHHESPGTTAPSKVSPSFSGGGRVFYFPGIPEEEYPESPFFSPEFQIGLINAMQIAKQSATILSQLISRQNSARSVERGPEIMADLKKRLGRASDLRNQPPTAKTIAFLGNSGEGKSSVINSLLDFPNIATIGNMGAACTSIVTEYRQKKPDQTQCIQIEVEYLSDSAIKEHIKELLWSFRRVLLPDIASGSGNVADITRYRTESSQAWSSLETAFSHEKNFNREFLEDISDGAFSRIANQLLQWTATIPWPQGALNGKWATYAKSAEECFEKTRPFMRDRLWPFTKIIRVCIDAPILNMGLVIVDLPGLLDVNLARVRATQEYISRCDHIFLVANISRAITDQSLKSSLYAAMNHHAPQGLEVSARKESQIAVICTNAESNINGLLSQLLHNSDSKLPLATQIIELDEKIKTARQNFNRELKKELKRQKEILLIESRNQHVKNGLQIAYSETFKEATLNVFCVSNTWYEKYRQKEKSGTTLKLVTTSGIPELRKFCYLLCAKSRFDEDKHFIRHTLSSIITSIGAYAKPESFAPAKNPTNNLGKVEDIRRSVLSEFVAAEKQFLALFKDLILGLFENRYQHWQEAAIEKGREWKKWDLPQYKTWCHKNGKARTLGGQLIDWNSELIWKMRMELDLQWDLFEEEIPLMFEKLGSSTLKWLQCLKVHLEEHGFSSTMVRSIDHRAEAVKNGLEKLKQYLESKVRYGGNTRQSFRVK
ncbi:uncharacterized protein N7484_007396 [Penicillium longicatenatum]|uniref:uncharacterized protein n=1 Tax=Penicillium longicatenatum TaxID=1561947 RepID=UPI00254761F0|nr:uncharacterized protein N7484_007396 [Penicillium longicatenatum]KAJ5639534.1 hypothetical protein N7484_007396 [Penicillium longicatenatum]